jgi:hypothetical protein
MQCVLGVDVMVEAHIVKTLGNMAGIAAFPKMSLVIVIFAVTGDTQGVHRVAERVIAVTITTYQWRVFTNQRESGVAGVIE